MWVGLVGLAEQRYSIRFQLYVVMVVALTGRLAMENFGWSSVISSLSASRISCREDKEETLLALKSLVKKSLQFEYRSAISAKEVSGLASTLINQTSLSSSSSDLCSDLMADIWCEALKLLRNVCVELPGNQLLILQEAGLLQCAANLALKFKELPDVPVPVPVTKVAMQLLGNVCVNQPSGRERVWHLCFPGLVRSVFAGPSANWGMACMLLHYSSMDQVDFKRQLCADTPDVVANILSCLGHCSCDNRNWSGHMISSLLSSLPLELVWKCCSPTGIHRLRLLHFLLHSDFLSSSQKNQTCPPGSVAMETNCPSPVGSQLEFYVRAFCESSAEILAEEGDLLNQAHRFMVTDDYAESAVQLDDETSIESGSDRIYIPPADFISVRTCHTSLQLLCSDIQCHTHLTRESASELTKISVGLLKELCNLDGSLSSSRNLSQLKSATPPQDRLSLHPLHCFKRDLVRLLGNLLYDSQPIQDFLRELGDIAQWSIFAIRNLCQGNPTNQQLIAGLKAQGASPLDEEVLQASGGELEIGDDGRARIKRRQT